MSDLWPLTMQHKAFAYHQAQKWHRFHWRRVSLEDMQQAALLGMLYAERKYNSDFKVKFISYASYWITRELQTLCVFKSKVVNVKINTATRKRIDPRSIEIVYENSFNTSDVADDGGKSWEAFLDRIGQSCNPPRLTRFEQRQAIAEKLEALDLRSRSILIYRAHGLTLSQVGTLLGGLSRERVRQLERDALDLIGSKQRMSNRKGRRNAQTETGRTTD